MMPMSPRPSLKFRKADFLRYGFKAGISDGAFLSTVSSSRRAVCLRPSYAPLPVASYPRSKSRDAVRWRTSVQAAQTLKPLYPRGPRSGPSYSVSVHPHLNRPHPSSPAHFDFASSAYTKCPGCAPYLWRLADRRLVPSFRWLFCIDMSSSETPGVPRLPTPSSFAVDAGLRPVGRVSAPPISSPSDSREGDNFGASLPFTFVTTCRFACPPVGADQVFTQPTRTFTSGLPTDWSPAPPPDITTGATGQVPLAGLSPARTPTSFAAARRYLRNSFLRCLALNPDGPTECTCLFLPRCHRPSLDPSQVGLPLLSANTIFRGEVSRLSSDNSFVQASEFARLPDRSHRCKFCRAAETSTSGQNVLRYLCTHRICYPLDTGN
jgi:hypothetical protein